MHNQNIGKLGEDLAEKYLSQKGYKIIERNFQCKWGEIDLIVTKNQRLIFVEVKTRTDLRFGRPEEAVRNNKRKALWRVICIYLREHSQYSSNYQLDVLAILLNMHTHKAQVRHIPNISIAQL